jgi:hypothetical protein
MDDPDQRYTTRDSNNWRRFSDPGVDSVALPPTESPHAMPRGKQPLVFGQWTRVGSETAFALGRYGIQSAGAGRGA